MVGAVAIRPTSWSSYGQRPRTLPWVQAGFRNQESVPGVKAGSGVQKQAKMQVQEDHYNWQRSPYCCMDTSWNFSWASVGYLDQSGAMREAVSLALQGRTSCCTYLHRVYMIMHTALSWLPGGSATVSMVPQPWVLVPIESHNISHFIY